MRNSLSKLAIAIAAANISTAYAVCPTHTNVTAQGTDTTTGLTQCQVSGVVLDPLVMDNQNLWVLEGRVEIGASITSPNTAGVFSIVEIDTTDASATTLTIDAGTAIIGDSAVGLPLDYLVINRGSDIFSNGSQFAPIRMTSRQALDDDAGNADGIAGAAAQWGGLYLNGYAPTNECNDINLPSAATGTCERAGEADTGRYGGASTNDNSGSVQYTSVSYAGFQHTSSSELNGIALQGVGSGTTLDYIQVHANSDDGIEFFGGNANVKHLVLTDNADDSFDTTGGWQGNVQYVIISQSNSVAADRAFESDNNKSPNNASPESNGKVSNVTIISDNVINKDGGTPDGVKSRRGSNLTYANVVIDKNFGTCFDATDGNGTGNLSAPLNSVLADCAGSLTDAADTVTWLSNSAGQVTASATSLDGYVNGTNETAVSATDMSAVNSFFDATDYIGAVKDCDNNWAAGWTTNLPAIAQASCEPTQTNVPAMGIAGLVALLGSLTLVTRSTKKQVK